MFRKVTLFPLLFAAFCLLSHADERFPDIDIQWIFDQYQVAEPVSLIPTEYLTGWTRYGGGKLADQSKWRSQEGKIILEFSEKTRDFQGGDIVTAKQYTNFVLDFAWIASQRCNSGIKYRVKDFGSTGARLARGWLGCEYQILNDGTSSGRESTASLYHIFAPDSTKKKVNPHGEINTGRIIVLDNHIEHWLNGEKVMQCEVGSDTWKEAVKKSKFIKDNGEFFGFGENPTGFIILQDHGHTVTFEKLVIREIGSKK